MSNVFKDIHEMHKKYGVHDWIKEQETKEDWSLLDKFMQFRLAFLREELNETEAAVNNRDPEEIVDGLIDLIVVAVGTLDAYNVDGEKAWKEVLKANMNKEVGVKASRPNVLGLPDLVKPDGWKGPDHSGNTGVL